MPSPGEYISIDEAMMKFFGRRCPITKSMPQKPIKKGFLFYCAVDYATKWVFDINLADGGYDNIDFADKKWGKTGQRVLDLIDHIPGHWHTIVTDNLYSSEALAIELLHRNQYFIGTLRKNRLPVGRPQEIVNKTKHPKPTRRCPKGTIHAAVNSERTISLYSFMDSGLVYVLDTKCYPSQMSEIVRKVGANDVNLNVYKGIDVYNSKMGGVDAWDALRTGYYAIENCGRKAKWTTRFIDGLFTMALTQCWVAYRYHHPDEAHFGRSDFFTAICAYFLDNTLGQNDHRRVTRHQEFCREEAAFGKHRTFVETTEISDDGVRRKKLSCVHCQSKKPHERLVVSKYSLRTYGRCRECGVALHSQCFHAYHNEKGGFPANV